MQPQQSTDAREPKFRHPSRSTYKRVSVARNSVLIRMLSVGGAVGKSFQTNTQKNVQTFTMKLRTGSKGKLFCVFQML